MSKKCFYLIFILLISCTTPDDSSIQYTTTTIESQETTTEPQEKTTESQETSTTTTVVQSTTTTTVAPSTNYLENRDIKLFRASTISDEHINILMDYVRFTEKSFFDDPRVKVDNLYPILIAQTDIDNYQSAIDLEGEFCQYLKDTYPDSHKEYCYYRTPQSDGSIGLFASDGNVYGSSISGNKAKSCCYLFISGSFDLSWDSHSQAITTIHEMFHIFQMSNYIDLPYHQDDREKISGKIVGDGNKHKSFWMEGNTEFLSHLYYARNVKDFDRFLNEMESKLYTDYGSKGMGTIIERYLSDGIKLYNYTFEGGWDNRKMGYQVGAWFTAYLVNIHGEDSILDFWFNTQSGIFFPENFLQTFGKDYKTYVDEFENFVRNNDVKTVMSILPSS